MANNLTGDFDAVVQVSVDAINGILATLHQNGLNKNASPTFPHSFATRVGATPEALTYEVARVAGWMQQAGLVSLGGDDGTLKRALAKVPPGVSQGLGRAIKVAYEAQRELTRLSSASGVAQVQLSTPRVSFSAGTTSEVTVHVRMRANYIPDAGTPALPEPVHGDVEVDFALEQRQAGSTRLLEALIPPGAGKIRFSAAAGAGLDAGEAGTIEQHVREVLRGGFEPINAELPEGFQFSLFKALGGGGGQAVALPVQLTGSPLPSTAINGVNNLFLGSTDQFAIGVSREFVLSLVQPSLDAIKASHPQFTVSGALGSALYTTTFTQADATWTGGKIRLQIKGESTTPTWWAPNVDSFSIVQELGLQLDVPAQTIQVVPLGPQGHPTVSVDVAGPLGGLVEGMIEPTVKAAFVAQRTAAINAAESQIQQVLSGNGNLENALQSFDSSAQARYKTMDTNADGVVLHGSIATKPRYQVIDEFTETGDEKGFSALKSWIPGGTIERFVWSWTDNPTPYIPWASTVKFFEDKHRFVLPKPDGVQFTSEICLVVTGRQVYSGTYSGPQLSPIGTEIPVTGGDTCSSRNSDPGMVATMPSWWDVVMRPVWEPDPPPESVLEQAIGAHVDMLSNPLGEGETGANTIVQFSDPGGAKPFDALSGPLSAYSGGEIPMALVLVLPRGTFARRRAEIESRLGRLDAFSGSVMITEDYENGWSRTFGVSRGPGTFLLNARGELAWGKSGELDTKAFASALKRNLIAGPRPEPRCLGLRMRVGDRIRDLLIHDLCGDRTALRKLRGRRLLLNFWQSWSMPCIRELRNLNRRQADAGRDALVVIAINGGESPERIDAFNRGQELDLLLARDPDRRIARAFGVTCWPTTLSVTEDGIVDGIQFGVATGRRPMADPQACRGPGIAG